MSAGGGGGVAPPAVAGGAGELCSLGNLLEVLLERSHQKLTRLVHALPTQPEETRYLSPLTRPKAQQRGMITDLSTAHSYLHHF
jgi:hypothetical protein